MASVEHGDSNSAAISASESVAVDERVRPDVQHAMVSVEQGDNNSTAISACARLEWIYALDLLSGAKAIGFWRKQSYGH